METNLDLIWKIIISNIEGERNKAPEFIPDENWLKERIKYHIESLSTFDDNFKGVTEKEIQKINKEARTRFNTKQPPHLFLAERKTELINRPD